MSDPGGLVTITPGPPQGILASCWQPHKWLNIISENSALLPPGRPLGTPALLGTGQGKAETLEASFYHFSAEQKE